MPRNASQVLLLGVVVFIQACAAPLSAAPPRHDEPIPAGEPREVLHLAIDLPKTATCEETFDLALYGSRAVDLVEWEGSSTKCAGRRAIIRFLPHRITREKLLESIKKLAVKTEVISS